jgi:hypothetical protein
VEQLNTYIQQARKQGQTDEQIRQSLIASGWNAEQVSSVLMGTVASSSVQLPTPVSQPVVYQAATAVMQNTEVGKNPMITPSQVTTSSKRRPKLPLTLVGLIILLLIIGSSVFALFGHKTSYPRVIQEFITAVQKKDKTTADSLESPAMKAYGQKNVGTPSFYAACQQAGDFCTPLFTSSFLDKASKTYKSYTASNGTKGEEVVYALKQSLNNGNGCTSSSINTLTIAVVPKGSTWQIDYADPTINASSNACSATSGSSSTGN